MLCKIYIERAEVTSQEWERMVQDDSFRGQNNGPTLQGSKGVEKEMSQIIKHNAARTCHINLRIHVCVLTPKKRCQRLNCPLSTDNLVTLVRHPVCDATEITDQFISTQEMMDVAL